MLIAIPTIFIFLFIWVGFNIFLEELIKEDVTMEKNIIEVTPNKDGKLFITLYGTKYQIVVKEQPKTATKPAKTDK